MSTLAAIVGRRLVLYGAGRGYVVRVTARGLVVQLDRGLRLHNVTPEEVLEWLPDKA